MVRLQAWVLLLGAAAVGVGCSPPNSSNPLLSVTSARLTPDAAVLALTVENPSDYDLHLYQVNYQLTLGPHPVGSGVWETHTDLPKGGTVSLTQTVPFDGSPLDASAGTVGLSGTMVVYPRGGTSAQSFTDTAFSVNAPIEE